MDLLTHSREKTTEAGKPGEEMDWSEMENKFEAITEMFDSKANLFRGKKSHIYFPYVTQVSLAMFLIQSLLLNKQF